MESLKPEPGAINIEFQLGKITQLANKRLLLNKLQIKTIPKVKFEVKDKHYQSFEQIDFACFVSRCSASKFVNFALN